MEIDKETIEKVISKLNRGELDFIDLRKEMQLIKEVAIVGISKNIHNLKNVIGKFENDKDIAKIVCEKKGEMLKFFSDEIKDDLEIVKISVKNNILAIKYASEKYRDNKAVMEKAVEIDPAYVMFASNRLKKNKNFMLLGLEKRHDLLKYLEEHAPYFFIDDEVVVKSLRSKSSIIENILKDNNNIFNNQILIKITNLCEEIFLELKESISSDDFPFFLEKYAQIVYNGELEKEKEVNKDLKRIKKENHIRTLHRTNNKQNKEALQLNI